MRTVCIIGHPITLMIACVLPLLPQVDALRADLQNLMLTLEGSAVSDREDLKREQLRLSREAARVEAAASSLAAERDDLRMQASAPGPGASALCCGG